MWAVIEIIMHEQLLGMETSSSFLGNFYGKCCAPALTYSSHDTLNDENEEAMDYEMTDSSISIPEDDLNRTKLPEIPSESFDQIMADLHEQSAFQDSSQLRSNEPDYVRCDEPDCGHGGFTGPYRKSNLRRHIKNKHGDRASVASLERREERSKLYE
jgi:hypothetical protein